MYNAQIVSYVGSERSLFSGQRENLIYSFVHRREVIFTMIYVLLMIIWMGYLKVGIAIIVKYAAATFTRSGDKFRELCY